MMTDLRAGRAVVYSVSGRGSSLANVFGMTGVNVGDTLNTYTDVHTRTSIWVLSLLLLLLLLIAFL